MVGAIVFEYANLALCAVKCLSVYRRQDPAWTYTQALVVQVLSSIVYHTAVLRLQPCLSLDSGREKERFVVVQPAPVELYTGILLSNTGVRPASIGATWYPALLSSSNVRHATVMLHMHGGAYVLADGRTSTSGSLASALLEHTPATHIFCPQYRLCSLPASKTSDSFPSALQDTLSGYYYLTEILRVPSSKIILSGDSAGGHIIIGFLRYLAQNGAGLGLRIPSACCLWSPLINPITNEDFTRTNPNYKTDYLSWPLLSWMNAALGGLDYVNVLRSPYVSFMQHPFMTEVPIYVNAGGKEVLCFDIVRWAEEMGAIAGNDVTLHVEANAPHDPLVLMRLGFAVEATGSASRAGRWLRIILNKQSLTQPGDADVDS